MLQNSQEVIEEIKEEIFKNLKTKENKNTTIEKNYGLQKKHF